MGKKQKAVGASKMKCKELISKLSSAKTIEKKKSTENKKIDSPLKNVEKKKVVKTLEKKKVVKSEEKKGKKADTPKLPCQTVAERVRELKKENVKISAAIRRQIGKDWEAMTPDEQKPYFVRANEAKESNKKAKRQLPEDVCHNVRKKMKAEEYSIKTRLSLKSIAKAVQNLTDDQVQAVKEIGFGGLLDLTCTHLDRELCGWLVSCFDPSMCSLNVHGKNMAVRTLDVENVMGIRSEGTLINNEASKEDISDLCKQYGFVDGQLKVSRLLKDLRAMVDGGNGFRQRFALLALGCLCCPSTKPGIKSSLIHFVKDPTALSTMNWERLLLDNLMTSVKNYKEKNTGGRCVGGCVFFLMVIRFERGDSRTESRGTILIAMVILYCLLELNIG